MLKTSSICKDYVANLFFIYSSSGEAPLAASLSVVNVDSGSFLAVTYKLLIYQAG